MSGNFLSLKGLRLPYMLYPALLHGCVALWDPQVHSWGLMEFYGAGTEPHNLP